MHIDAWVAEFWKKKADGLYLTILETVLPISEEKSKIFSAQIFHKCETVFNSSIFYFGANPCLIFIFFCEMSTHVLESSPNLAWG